MEEALNKSLSRAIRETSLVRVVRRMDPDEASSCCGFVIQSTAELILLHQLSDQIFLDGFTVLRIADITTIQFDFPSSRMSKKVLAIRGVKPVQDIQLTLHNMKEALTSVSALFPLVIIEREFVSNGECEIGQLKMIGDDVYVLRWITPDADWEPNDRTFKIKDITRLQFGGGYETALSLAAGLVANSD